MKIFLCVKQDLLNLSPTTVTAEIEGKKVVVDTWQINEHRVSDSIILTIEADIPKMPR